MVVLSGVGVFRKFGYRALKFGNQKSTEPYSR